MKKLYPRALFQILTILPLPILAQLNNGAISARFGVDGDTRSNYAKYGPVTGIVASDDWFSYSAGSTSVIDTSGASIYLALLQAGTNLGFNKRMSVPLYSKLNGRLWLDAVYGRDYISSNPSFDSTLFTVAAKNGDNPTNWMGGVSNIPDKNDLVDVYAHMRRDGTTVYDSMWLFTGVSTVGVSGSRYFDIELYKKDFSYNSAAGTFSTAGTEAGHTAWLFDAAGNITQTGDMILAVNYSPGVAPVVDLRIWVSQTTYSTVVPSYFNFGPNFDGATPAYGYASIVSKSGATAFGAGIANYSAIATQDTTESTPWGTEQSTKNWGTQYQSLQLVEIGLNLTRIGLDPALYTAMGLNPCTSLFSDIFFKSRSSNSFVSNMQDFVTPLQFLRNPVMDYSLKPDTLRCNRTVGTIQITNNTTVGTYSWTVLSGNISGSNTDSSQINVTKAGKYVVSASPAVGCPATRTDTVIIPIDTFPPVASINATVGSNYSYLQLIGGDTAASNYPTPFGGSQGLLWNWSGPDGFTSTVQSPVTDTAWGNYQLIVTEKRNGCKDTAVKPLNIWDFTVLAAYYMHLTGVYGDESVQLQWQNILPSGNGSYTVERSVNGTDFVPLGEMRNGTAGDDGKNTFGFLDRLPVEGRDYYRILMVSNNGIPLYSNTIEVDVKAGASGKIYLASDQQSGQVSLICMSDKDCQAQLVLHDMAGHLLYSKFVQLTQGLNVIPVGHENAAGRQARVVSLWKNHLRAFSQQAIF